MVIVLFFLLILPSLLTLRLFNGTIILLLTLAISLLLFKIFFSAKNLILILLVLELFLILNLIVFSTGPLINHLRASSLLTIITMAVSEASIGLGTLIVYSRKRGTSSLLLLFFLKLKKLLTFKVKNLLN